MNALNDLRSRAEVVLRKKSIVPPDISTLPTTELQKLVHELQVHQVELEMQNHELRTTQLALQESQKPLPGSLRLCSHWLPDC